MLTYKIGEAFADVKILLFQILVVAFAEILSDYDL